MSLESRGRPLRVALVTSSYNFIADGVALTLNRLVGYLLSRGVEVLVFTPVAKAPAFAHQGEIVPVPSAPIPLRSEYRLAFGLPRAQRDRLRRFDPDIIHIAVPDILGHQALKFALELGRPVVASYHTRYETYLKYYGLDVLRGAAAQVIARFYGACREVYVPSESMAEVLGREIGRERIHLWQRGVDTRRSARAAGRSACRASSARPRPRCRPRTARYRSPWRGPPAGPAGRRPLSPPSRRGRNSAPAPR